MTVIWSLFLIALFLLLMCFSRICYNSFSFKWPSALPGFELKWILWSTQSTWILISVWAIANIFITQKKDDSCLWCLWSSICLLSLGGHLACSSGFTVRAKHLTLFSIPPRSASWPCGCSSSSSRSPTSTFCTAWCCVAWRRGTTWRTSRRRSGSL